MSHFVVMVTNTDEEPVDSQLERFNEQGEADDYFMEKEYAVEKNWDSIKEYVDNEVKWYEGRLNDKETKPDQKEYFNKCIAEIKSILKAKNLEEALELVKNHDGGSIDEGGVYHIYNPNAKWDWYSIGGRWDAWLVNKMGIGTNVCKIKDIDFDKMREADAKDAEFYYDTELKRAKKEDRKPWFWGFKETPTKEEYLKYRAEHFNIAPFAVLHEDEWIERGSMGWFGVVSEDMGDDDWEKEFLKFFNSLDPETEVTIVDCHI